MTSSKRGRSWSGDAVAADPRGTPHDSRNGPLAINAFDKLLAFVRDIAEHGTYGDPEGYKDEAREVLAAYDATTLAAFHRRLLGVMNRLAKFEGKKR